MQKMLFESPSLGILTLEAVIERILAYQQETDHTHKIIIGTDSAPPDGTYAEFVTAIVVHRVGSGGIYFWRKTGRDQIHTLRDRMYHEAVCSLEIAQCLVRDGLVSHDINSANSLEIHVDIGMHGPTRQMIKEIVGMVAGSGFRVKTKPDAFAANKVADRYT